MERFFFSAGFQTHDSLSGPDVSIHISAGGQRQPVKTLCKPFSVRFVLDLVGLGLPCFVDPGVLSCHGPLGRNSHRSRKLQKRAKGCFCCQQLFFFDQRKRETTQLVRPKPKPSEAARGACFLCLCRVYVYFSQFPQLAAVRGWSRRDFIRSFFFG